MAKETPAPELVKVGSHSVQLGHSSQGVDREELYPVYRATWRGRPVVVEMRGDRYRHSSGLSDWRVYAGDAREAVEGDEYGRGPALTETARRRLSDELSPLVLEWLSSDAYTTSRQAAFAHAIEREFGELRTWSHATLRVRDRLRQYGSELTAGEVARFEQAADAYDAFVVALKGDQA